MRPTVSLSHALTDPSLFGKVFAAPSFWTWRVVAKLIDGLPLTEPREVELYRECTGRTRLPSGPLRRLIMLAGRRAGKDRFESGVAVWRAALCTDWRRHQSAGEGAVVILLGADKRQAAILRRYCQGLLQVPLLAREVVRTTGDMIEFRNGSSLEIATNDVRLVRGRSAIAVLGSECCHWKTDEHAASSDEEVVGAAEPSMGMCPDGGLLLLGSSVYRKRGYMYRKWKDLHGDDGNEDICWSAPSRVMNPRLPAGVIERALAEDAPKARAEYENVWREDLSDFVPLDVVEACTDRDVHERPPEPDVFYVAFCDAASGTGTDSYALCIAHYDSERETVAIDVVREYRPRFVPAHVIAELAQVLQRYRISVVYGDRAFAGFHSDEWLRNATEYRPCLRTTSENYLAALPRMLAGRVRLLDSARARSQFAALERRPLVGHEHVDHPRTASAHDDVAASIAGAVAQVARAVAMGEIGWQWNAPIIFDQRTGASLSLGPSADARVPQHYLKGPDEPWRPYIGAGGEIKSTAGWAPPGGWTPRKRW
jgi:hypothetical protein